MTQDVQNTRFQLLTLDRQQKSIELQRRQLLKKLSDPQKNKNKFKIIKFLYQLVLETPVSDELDIQDFIKKILSNLNQSEYNFFLAHKHDNFYSHKKLLMYFNDDEIQVALRKSGYINLTYFNKYRLATIHQIFYYIAEAKIQHQKDILLSELKSLKIKEQLRYTLFEQEGFNQIVDYNERECLLMLKSYPNLKNKDLLEKTTIPRSNWYRYKNKFHGLKLL